MKKEIYKASDLRRKLQREHNSSFYYRGQNRIYQYPLWPSMYRACHIFDEKFTFPKSLSRRNLGEHFGFRTMFLRDEFSEKEIDLRELKRLMMAHVRNALGYCLSEALFQQAGWESEGLDVTDNIDIALFFATHKYYNGVYSYVGSTNETPSVIYRWSIPQRQEWTLETLNDYNFYNRPPIVPSKKILSAFDVCSSDELFTLSIERYRQAINWSIGWFDLDVIESKRPYRLIKMPRKWLTSSRIVNQHAALLFPDTISADVFLANYTPNNPDAIESIQGGLFIEDLSMGYNCETFAFTANQDDRNSSIDIGKIYPKDDFSHIFITGWMKAFHKNNFGLQSFVVPGDDTYLSILHSKFSNEDFDAMFKDHETKFNN